jgi:hypothetical protein
MAIRAVLLKTALTEGSLLKPYVKVGIGALENADIRLIAADQRPKIGDSLNLDDAMKHDFPNANRWDYLISVSSVNKIVGVEPHSARDSEISVVIAKKNQAVTFLIDHLPPKHRVAQWFWVSHGAVRFSAMERARRLLDQNGIAFEGRLLRSFG